MQVLVLPFDSGVRVILSPCDTIPVAEKLPATRLPLPKCLVFGLGWRYLIFVESTVSKPSK